MNSEVTELRERIALRSTRLAEIATEIKAELNGSNVLRLNSGVLASSRFCKATGCLPNRHRLLTHCLSQSGDLCGSYPQGAPQQVWISFLDGMMVGGDFVRSGSSICCV